MFKFRKEIVNEMYNSETKQNEEKTNSNNNHTSSTDGSNPNPHSYRRFRYKRFRRIKEDEEKATNDHNKINDKNNATETPGQKDDNTQLEKESNVTGTNGITEEENNIKENSNHNINNRKQEILDRLKEVVPIIEDKEGEENLTPNKQKESNFNDIDNKSLSNNMFKNQLKIEDNDFNDVTNKKFRNSMNGMGHNKKRFENQLIDAILDVEKYNVKKYLSKDLVSIYDEITKDNDFFKHDVFLENIANFEKKTGNLDRKKDNNLYNDKDNKKNKYMDITNTDEIINKFFEKSKTFN